MGATNSKRTGAPASFCTAGWPAAASGLQQAVIATLILAPWLFPWAPGPSPNTIPLLFAWLAAAWLPAAVSAGGFARAGTAVATIVGLACLTAGAPLGTAAAAAAIVAVACSAIAGALPFAGRLMALGWLAAAVLSSCIALAQYFGWGGAVPQLIAHANLGEAYGNLRQRNQFATLTALGLVSLLWLSSQCRRRWLFAGALVILAAGNAASASRTGALQWVMIAGVSLWWGGASRRWAAWAVAGCFAYLAAAWVLPVLLEALSGHSAPNVFSRMAPGPFCGSRTILWSNVFELSLQRPLLGWGWGELDYAHYAHLYTGERFCDILDNAHNLPLHLAVELGWPLACTVCAAALWLLFRMKPWGEPDPLRRMAWLALAILVVHSSVEYPLWYGPFQMALGLAVGLLSRRQAVPEHVTAPVEPKARLWPAWAFASFATAVIAYVAWDYRRISQLYIPPEDRAATYREQTLEKARASWLFRDQVRFAELSITPLARENAADMHQLALDMLHFSPEPKVIATVIDSALLLRRHDVALQHTARFKAAFPEEYAKWSADRSGLTRAP